MMVRPPPMSKQSHSPSYIVGRMTHTEQLLINRHNAIALTMDQLAQEMQVTKPSLQNMISAGRCPVETTGAGKLRRAHITSIAAWMDGRQQ